MQKLVQNPRTLKYMECKGYLTASEKLIMERKVLLSSTVFYVLPLTLLSCVCILGVYGEVLFYLYM